MISPQEIRERARKLWVAGQLLRAAATDPQTESPSLFPYSMPFRRPSAQEWLERFAELRAAIAQLEGQSKAALGTGYSITFRETAHQKLGRLKTPERITFDTVEDLAASAGELDALRRFRVVTHEVEVREPRLKSWTLKYPLRAIAVEERISKLLDTVQYFEAHPRPNRFARELGIPGVDSKFIEENQMILSEWLDVVLPSEAIDESSRSLTDHGFERRYGLRYEESQIRYRWLDPSRVFGGIADATVPLSQLAAYGPACDCVFVTENKVNFLTLPKHIGAFAIFGGGYAIDLLRDIPWLTRQPLYYWGDLDTHGFAILSRLRNRLPHARSFLMNRPTLIEHRDLWTEELSATRVLCELEHLNPDEHALYDDLRYDRLGDRVRLEQERIPYSTVQEAMASLLGASKTA